jgi:hypothetical protein
MTSTPTSAAAPASATLSGFGKFALVFGLTFIVTYVVCDFMGWPLFTYHPATNRLAWGYEAARRGEGPAMYWYGWTVMCVIVSSITGFLATLLPDSVVRRIPLALTWILPLLALPLLVYSLMPFWTK